MKVSLPEHEPLTRSCGPEVPALVFAGEHDLYTTPSECRVVASAFREATFTTVPAADHLSPLERFGATLALLDGFLGPPEPWIGSGRTPAGGDLPEAV